ncbi:MAG TPA: hypothetical protein VM345_02435 [Acidimicrobiales bacterium]|jgi:hypothetical protein|nr:hypothetical protein [Acidimicrobiales bacterium]
MRRFRNLLMATAASIAAFGAYAEPTFAARPEGTTADVLATFTEVGTVDGAAAQPTVVGRRIVTLQEWQGKVYAGYGDWGANTGPITVSSTPANGTGFTAEFVLDTEAVEVMRPINGHLVVPHTDPRSGASDFALGTPWTESAGVGATHVFDAATLMGDDLWLVGSRGPQAVAWRSADGGATWSVALAVDPSDPGSFARFHFAAVVGGKLFVQAWTGSAGNEGRSYVFDGSSWSRGRPLVERYQQGRRPTAMSGRVVYATSPAGYAGELRVFDGKRATVARSGVLDFAVSGEQVFALGADANVWMSSDMRSWAVVAQAPLDAISITAAGNQLWVGTAASTVWRSTLG